MRLLRSRFELACRIGAFGLLGWLLGASLIPSSGRRVERATTAQIESRLASWTRSPATTALHGDFNAAPSARAIDWLAALKRSGHVVTWSGSPPALALSAEALADPRGGARVDVAAPAGAHIAVRDDASAIDSIRVGSLGGSITAPVIVGRVSASSAGETASADVPDSTRLRSIIVLGAAGWEGKFIVAALEERGWPVVPRFTVAPSVDVTPAGMLALDTARVAAVVVVDTSLQSLGGAIERYVRSGGGLILAGPAAMTSLSDLAPGSVLPRVRPAVLPADTIGLGSTGFYPVAALKSDAVVLERRSAGIAVAARRVGAGRVIQLGYDDSWRWRMAGAAGSENAHREWWSRLISAVAYAPPFADESSTSTTRSAPLATLVDRLGVARATSPAGSGRGPMDRRLLFAAMMILLLLEWASRRLRGLK